MYQNFIVIGPILSLVFIFILFLPIYKACRKVDGPRPFSNRILKIIIEVFSTFYFFMIQESMMIIIISFTYGTDINGVGVAISLLYFISLVLYFANQCYFPLSFFRNKQDQFLTFLARVLGPFFLIFPRSFHFLFFPTIFFIYLFEIIFTNENINKSKYNRLFLYKFVFLLTLISSFIYYLI